MLLSTVSAFAATTVTADDVSAKTEQVTVLVSGVTADEEVAIMVYDSTYTKPSDVPADEIWYIDQAAADSKGEVTFKFYLKADATDATKKVAIGSAKADVATYDTFEVKAAASYTPGDVNGDKKINSRDAGLVARVAAGHTITTTFIRQAADVNADKKINSRDAGLIARYAAGHSVTLQEGKLTE